MENSCSNNNLLVCLAVLAALNLGIVIAAPQIPISSFNLNALAQHIEPAQRKPNPVRVVCLAGRRFESVAGANR